MQPSSLASPVFFSARASTYDTSLGQTGQSCACAFKLQHPQLFTIFSLKTIIQLFNLNISSRFRDLANSFKFWRSLCYFFNDAGL
jgi:hypothetical protein